MSSLVILYLALAFIIAGIGASMYALYERKGIRALSCLIIIIGGCFFMYAMMTSLGSFDRTFETHVATMEKLDQERESREQVERREREVMAATFPMKSRVSVGIMVIGYEKHDSIKVLMDTSGTIETIPVTIVNKDRTHVAPEKE